MSKKAFDDRLWTTILDPLTTTSLSGSSLDAWLSGESAWPAGVEIDISPLLEESPTILESPTPLTREPAISLSPFEFTADADPFMTALPRLEGQVASSLGPTQLWLSFDASPLLRALTELQVALKIPTVSADRILAFAARRSLHHLPGYHHVLLASLESDHPEMAREIPPNSALPEVLGELPAGRPPMSEGGLLYATDAHDLGLEGLSLRTRRSHLLLANLTAPAGQPPRGTVSLEGSFSARRGASFLQRVIEYLEAPIRLLL